MESSQPSPSNYQSNWLYCSRWTRSVYTVTNFLVLPVLTINFASFFFLHSLANCSLNSMLSCLALQILFSLFVVQIQSSMFPSMKKKRHRRRITLLPMLITTFTCLSLIFDLILVCILSSKQSNSYLAT
jgi:hypothetical protein